ncbi:MAG: hypothetical protein ACRD2N_16190 [Vicinamibacterales bacterium]
MDRRDEIGEAIAKEISHTIAKKITIGIALFFGFLFFIAFGGVVVLLLWNWLVPDIFNLRRLTFWEALGLLALCRILFGGFGKSAPAHSDGGRRGGARKAWWKASRPPARDTATAAPTSTPETQSPEATNNG